MWACTTCDAWWPENQDPFFMDGSPYCDLECFQEAIHAYA